MVAPSKPLDGPADTAMAAMVRALSAGAMRRPEQPLTLDQCALLTGVAGLLPGVFAAGYDAEGRYVWVSAALTALLGVGADDLLGRPISALFTTAWCDERLDVIDQALRSGRPLTTVEVFRGRRLESLVLPVLPGVGVIYIGRFGLALPAPNRANGADPALPPRLLEEADWGPLSTLTRRELEVLRFVAGGLDNAQIAARLHRSKRAVEWHVKNLYEYLRCGQRTDLFRIGLQAGLPDIDEAHWAGMMARVRSGPEPDHADHGP